MATLADVEDALTTLISAQLYPNAPSPSALGYPVKVYAGWPSPQQLDADMVEAVPGIPTAAHVSVYPLPGERNLTRFPAERRERPRIEPTYTIQVNGQLVTIGGQAPATYFVHNFGFVIDGYAYVYQPTAGLSADQVAAGLHALVAEDFPDAAVAGPVITLPSVARPGQMRLGTVGDVVREVRRQEKQFQVSVWAPNPAARDVLANTFDPIMADTPFLAMPDGTHARLTYKGSRDDDFGQKVRVYRRSFIWCVEYGTTITERATQIIAPLVSLLDSAGADILDIPARPPGESSPVVGELDFQDPEHSDLLPGL
jgi:hypothetical protein